jgi:hypothetical protein
MTLAFVSRRHDVGTDREPSLGLKPCQVRSTDLITVLCDWQGIEPLRSPNKKPHEAVRTLQLEAVLAAW